MQSFAKVLSLNKQLEQNVFVVVLKFGITLERKRASEDPD